MMPHAERKARLEALLLDHAPLWRPQPFKDPNPAWMAIHPALARQALALDGAVVERLAADNAALVRWIAGEIPALSELEALLDLPRAHPRTLPDPDAHLSRDIPGRKAAQIGAFAAALQPLGAPILEWCAGKGHLGRLLARLWGQPVTSLEIDPALCAAGEVLARQARVGQVFLQADALAPDSARHLAGRHAVALHACGDLHHALIGGAIDQAALALDLVPCCYYRTADEIYRPFCGGRLQLNHDDLRLAVTDTATAPPRLRRRSRQAMAWKLAFQALRRETTGEGAYRPLKPVPESWMQAGFAAWCRRLAEREALVLQTEPDWAALEEAGWRAAARVRRLELVRLAFRRALEVWLLLDMAVHLEGHGYRLGLAAFCDPSLTPRNLLLSARRC